MQFVLSMSWCIDAQVYPIAIIVADTAEEAIAKIGGTIDGRKFPCRKNVYTFFGVTIPFDKAMALNDEHDDQTEYSLYEVPTI